MIDSLVASGKVPDVLLRKGIQTLLKKRLKDDVVEDVSEKERLRKEFIHELKSSPIAIETDKANDQHYQVPTSFFEYVLGDRMKYSCALWERGTEHLSDAEEKMIELTLQRADIRDGDRVLELGCGWGAFSLYIAKKYPNCQVTAVSNSKTQKDYIMGRAREQGLENIAVKTCNVAHLQLDQKFDRVISIEMFEHMRNYQQLLKNISGWLDENGKLFVHIFTHKDSSYKFEVKDESDWMSKYFFSGGTMPSNYLLFDFQEDLKIVDHWFLPGTHYAKTARAWLERMDQHKSEIMEIFNQHYGKGSATKWWNYWRVFFMSCEELWKYKNGQEWQVGHYLFTK